VRAPHTKCLVAIAASVLIASGLAPAACGGKAEEIAVGTGGLGGTGGPPPLEGAAGSRRRAVCPTRSARRPSRAARAPATTRSVGASPMRACATGAGSAVPDSVTRTGLCRPADDRRDDCAPLGYACSSTEACCSMNCEGGFCGGQPKPCGQPGEACFSDPDCCSKRCVGGICLQSCKPTAEKCALGLSAARRGASAMSLRRSASHPASRQAGTAQNTANAAATTALAASARLQNMGADCTSAADCCDGYCCSAKCSDQPCLN